MRRMLVGNIFFICLMAVSLILGNNKAFSQDKNSDDIKLIKQELEQLKKKVGEVDELKKRVSTLEEKVKEQQLVIKQQREVLETVSKVVPAVKKALVPPEQKVLVKKFVLKGVHLFTVKDFGPILSKYRDKELTLSQLKEIAREITNL